jgi:autotransporter passenger strand-loop-strand repeat protein
MIDQAGDRGLRPPVAGEQAMLPDPHVAGAGEQIIWAGGTASSTTLRGDSAHTGIQDIFGLAQNTIVSSAGTQQIQTGGLASNAIVDASGQQFVTSGGTANGSTISSGGIEAVYL